MAPQSALQVATCSGGSGAIPRLAGPRIAEIGESPAAEQ